MSRKGWVAATLAGSVAGALILGLGGRLATAVLAVTTAHHPNLSLRGVLESALAGLVLGAVGGLLWPVMRRSLPDGRMRAVALGAVLFFFSMAVSWFTGRLVARAELPATLAVALALFLVYGFVVDRMLRSGGERGIASGGHDVPLRRLPR